jgi:hypothetical protein
VEPGFFVIGSSNITLSSKVENPFRSPPEPLHPQRPLLYNQSHLNQSVLLRKGNLPMTKKTRVSLIPIIGMVITSLVLAACNLPEIVIETGVVPTETSGQSQDTPTATIELTGITPTSTTAVTAGPCEDRTFFIDDVTIEDNSVVKANADFIKTWRLQNTGTCTWDSTYKLVFNRGEQMNGPSPADVISIPVPPGGTVDLSVTMKAPAQNGTHLGIWQLFDRNGQPVRMADGNPQEVSVKILVQDGTGGKVTKIQGWHYTYTGTKCTNSVQYDIWTSIFTDGPVDVNYVWSTTNGSLSVVSQNYSFTSAGSLEVTTHIMPPFANPNNLKLTLTVNGSLSSSFIICP